MDSNKILKSDFLDILFDGRNKEYGAYELRKNYNRRMAKAMFIGIAGIVLIFSTYLIGSTTKSSKTKKVLREVELKEPPPMDETKPPPPPPPPEPPPPVRAQVKFVPPEIKKDNEIKENEMPPKEEMDKKDVSVQNVKGNNTDDIQPDIVVVPKKEEVKVEEPKVDNKIYEFVEQDPEYPGGENALLQFLADNMKYPNQARDNGIEGTVNVQFVVMEDGSVSQVKVVKGIGYGCDEEAKRVIAKLRNFKPGRQNGKPVKVYYDVPVRFVLQ